MLKLIFLIRSPSKFIQMLYNSFFELVIVASFLPSCLCFIITLRFSIGFKSPEYDGQLINIILLSITLKSFFGLMISSVIHLKVFASEFMIYLISSAASAKAFRWISVLKFSSNKYREVLPLALMHLCFNFSIPFCENMTLSWSYINLAPPGLSI